MNATTIWIRTGLKATSFLFVLGMLTFSFFSCTEPPKEDCPSYQIAGADLSLCCEALATCCTRYTGEKKSECEGNVSSGATLSCQAMYQEARAMELCEPFLKKDKATTDASSENTPDK